MLENAIQNMGFNNLLAPEAQLIGRRVIVERIGEETQRIPAEVSGVDKGRGKFLITSLVKPRIEFAASFELILGETVSRNGRLRYELLPEPKNLISDPNIQTVTGNVWVG